MRPIRTAADLEKELSTPTEQLISFLKKLDGDIAIIGTGGKMGPSLARLLRNAVLESGTSRKIVAISRFSAKRLRVELRALGVQVIAADLLDDEQLQSLPGVKNVLYLVGQKFGTAGSEEQSWAINTYLAGRVVEKFRNSRIVALSTGNVYPLVPSKGRGAKEDDSPRAVGEYAQSRLGGERLFQYFSRKLGTPVAILRLNYAIDLRYGVLHDVARSVLERKPIDLRMGWANVIWQRDANELVVLALGVASSPPVILNVTGLENVSIRWLAEEFGKLFGVEPKFDNKEEKTALLSDASRMHELFGYPKVPLSQMIYWVAEWLKSGGVSLNRPTHFQEREGRF